MGSRPFEFEFLDEHFAQLYQSEKQVTQVATLLAILAIFIACLGLFGLATISTEQRIKEIGIRKVLGATVPNIMVMLSKDFIVLQIKTFTKILKTEQLIRALFFNLCKFQEKQQATGHQQMFCLKMLE